MLALWLNGSVRERVEGTSVDARGNTARQSHDMGAAGSRDAEQREVQARCARPNDVVLQAFGCEIWTIFASGPHTSSYPSFGTANTTLSHKLLVEVVAPR